MGIRLLGYPISLLHCLQELPRSLGQLAGIAYAVAARVRIPSRPHGSTQSTAGNLTSCRGHNRSMGLATDGELWRRAVAEEPDAFGALFERHARTVYNYLFRRTADWALAEDLTSVVFLEAWRRRREVRLEHESALPWLYGVATNVLRNRRRSQRRHRAALERIPREHDEGFAEDAHARLDDERRVRVLLRSVSKLPKREQDVLALCARATSATKKRRSRSGFRSAPSARGFLARGRADRELDGPGGHEGGGKRAVPAEEA